MPSNLERLCRRCSSRQPHKDLGVVAVTEQFAVQTFACESCYSLTSRWLHDGAVIPALELVCMRLRAKGIPVQSLRESGATGYDYREESA